MCCIRAALEALRIHEGCCCSALQGKQPRGETAKRLELVAEQLQQALLVNPHDIAGTADAVHRALSMALEERRERFQALMASVQAEDIGWWRRRFLESLEATLVPA